MKLPLPRTFRVAALFKGFVILGLLLSPLAAGLILFLGIMGGAGPGAPGALTSFLLAAGFIVLVPSGVFLAHIVIGKLVDTLCFMTPVTKAEISWFGLATTGLVLVILGNIYVDDLYQFRQGDFTLSFLALGADLFGMILVAACSAIPIPFLSRAQRES